MRSSNEEILRGDVAVACEDRPQTGTGFMRVPGDGLRRGPSRETRAHPRSHGPDDPRKRPNGRSSGVILRIILLAVVFSLLGASGCALRAKDILKETDSEDLCGWLEDDRSWVREYAAFRLGQLKCVRATHDLCSLLKDDKPWVRVRAAEALGRIGDPDAFGPLTAALLRNDTKSVQCAILSALAAIGRRDPEVMDAIRNKCRSRHLIVRGAARAALNKLEPEK